MKDLSHCTKICGTEMDLHQFFKTYEIAQNVENSELQGINIMIHSNTYQQYLPEVSLVASSLTENTRLSTFLDTSEKVSVSNGHLLKEW